ncbi:MAG: phenylacetate--CoA ligase family protein, partial [Dehalococcoidia bacterium]|nr:phenylacetate--CoA ligase family protein [Dehalococcoidia bacterium]
MLKAKSGHYFDELETMTPEAREKYLNQKLAETIAFAYQNALSTKEIMDKAGVSPSQIQATKDLEKIPITRKAELIALQKARPPYGGFLTIPPENVTRVFISPGPIYEPHIGEQARPFAKPFYAAGFKKGDIVVNTFSYHMSPGGLAFHGDLQSIGATVIPMGVGNTEAQIQAMHDLKVTGFVGTPSFLMTVIKRTEELGYDFRCDFAVRKAWFTGEMLSPSLRKSFEEDHTISTAQAYAVTEVGGCPAYE